MSVHNGSGMFCGVRVIAAGLLMVSAGCGQPRQTPGVGSVRTVPAPRREAPPQVRVRPLPVEPPRRGAILDRGGRVLAAHAVRYNVYLVPGAVESGGLEALRNALALERAWLTGLRDQITRMSVVSKGRAMLVVSGVRPKQWRRAQERLRRINGVWVRAVSSRRYPLGDVASHVLGHLGEVSDAELKRGYRVRDRVGRFGVERLYERTLRGIYHGRGRPSTPGRRVVLTLDAGLQQDVEKALIGHAMAAAVVVEVGTGRILAMASRPGLPLRRLASPLSPRELKKLVAHPQKPFWDRSVMAAVNPGSTYSVIAALTALQTKRPRVARTVRCLGGVTHRKLRYRCVARHGRVSAQRALVRGCRSYFYAAAKRLGTDRLARVALAFGLGQKTGLGLNDEAAGTVPTVAGLQRTTNLARDAGHAMNAAIGQGQVTVTPLQLALVYAAIANGGRLYHPQLVLRTERANGKPYRRFKPRLRRRVKVTARALGAVRRALRLAVTQRGGVARRAQTASVAGVAGVAVAGLVGSGQGGAHGYRAPGTKNHAWFAGYAPARRPKISVVVLVQEGGSGAGAAAPTAAKIIGAYFKRQRAKPKIATLRR